jgi:serine phosphatase RsbU (regulator of sigma subunit)
VVGLFSLPFFVVKFPQSAQGRGAPSTSLFRQSSKFSLRLSRRRLRPRHSGRRTNGHGQEFRAPGLLARFSMPALLDSVNAVLPSVKEPDMFVTFAALRFDTPDTAEFTLAGHPPLLHFSQAAQRVSRRAMIQYPLGLMPAGGYLSEPVPFVPGDIFALVTDGLIETLNQKDDEFGLQRLEHLLLQNAARPLSEIFDALIAAVSAFGPQKDDRTVLLVRILKRTPE